MGLLDLLNPGINPGDQQPLPTGPAAQVAPAPNQASANWGPSSIPVGAQPPAAPQQQPAPDTSSQTISVIQALAGLGLNLAGLAAAHPVAAGDGVLAQSAKSAEAYKKQQADLQQQQDDQEQQKQDQALVQKLAAKIPMLQDPKDQAIATQMAQGGDPKQLQAYIDKQLGIQTSAEKYQDHIDRLNEKLSNTDTRFDVAAAGDLVKDYAGALKEGTKSLRDDAANALKIEQAARSAADPNKVNVANLSLQQPALFKGWSKDQKAALQAKLDEQAAASKQGGFLGFGSSIPKGTTSDQVFNGLAGKMVDPQTLQAHVAAVGNLATLKSHLQAAQFVQANISSHDAASRAKAQHIFQTLRANPPGVGQ